MPCKTISAREKNNLLLIGGAARRRNFAMDSSWQFPELTNLITPSTEQTHVTQLQNTTSMSIMSQNDDRSFSTSSNEEFVEDLSYFDDESEYNDIDESEYNDKDTTNLDGNIVIHLPELLRAIKSIACCKKCTESRHMGYVEEFVAFCTNERRKYLINVRH
jgi:hypothetical protein